MIKYFFDNLKHVDNNSHKCYFDTGYVKYTKKNKKDATKSQLY